MSPKSVNNEGDKCRHIPHSDKVVENRMEQCNMDLKSIEVFLLVLKCQVLLECPAIYSSYKTACSLVRQIGDCTQPKK